MSIKQLPSDVVAQIKSSIAITSLNSVILGLLKNSLDAQCSKISLSVDYRRGNCSVEDNGLGIAPAEFLEKGGLGKLHCKGRLIPNSGTQLILRRYIKISS
jgi:DNA mismatch repair protein MLH3